MKLWHVILGMVVLIGVVVGIVSYTQKKEDERWQRYAVEHHCKLVENYFDVMQKYSCDNGETTWR